jgi:hypothetical protein
MMDKELVKFWEKCGWFINEFNNAQYNYDNGTCTLRADYPELTLDNLFKYSWDVAIEVVKKTMECSKENAISLLFKWFEQNIQDNKTPQESLYQALRKVIL